MPRRLAIVGVGQTRHRGRRPDVNQTEMVNEAVRAALADAQLTTRDIDVVVQGDMPLFQGCYLGDMWHVDGTGSYMKQGLRIATGGTTGASCSCAAFYLVASGLFDTALAIGWQKHDEGDPSAGLTTGYDPLTGRLIQGAAFAGFAAWANRYMKTSGARPEHAAMVRLKADKNACRNPYAHLRLGLKSIDEVLQARVLAWPLRLLDLCPPSCGACAIIVASEERAKKITPKPVWVKDWVVAHQESLTAYGATRAFEGAGEKKVSQTVCAKKLYARNGITDPFKQIDVLEMYEAATWAELIWMEDFLLCGEGEAWKLVERGATELEGELPINPSGGVVSANPIGATAMIRIAEAALQIRSDAGEHQVPKDVDTALATALGGINWTVMTLLKKSLD